MAVAHPSRGGAFRARAEFPDQGQPSPDILVSCSADPVLCRLGVTVKLPPVLRPVFQPATLFNGPSLYVIDGVVTWGYVLPFFLSNLIANIYGYFINMKTTFRGSGSRSGLIAYLLILTALILFSTWLQGWITARLTATAFEGLARTIAATAAGLVQVAVLFPLEKYVLFRKA